MIDAGWNSPATKWCAVVLAAGLFVLVGVVAPSWARLKLSDPPPISSPEITYPQILPLKPFEAFSDVTEHPIFNSDRKKDPAAPPVLGPALDSYRLAGVVTAGKTRVALVERRATKAVLSLKVGDSLDGRTVKKITSAAVIFAGPADEALQFPVIQGASFARPKSTDTTSQVTTKRGL